MAAKNIINLIRILGLVIQGAIVFGQKGVYLDVHDQYQDGETGYKPYSHPHYMDDGMGRHDKETIMKIAVQLIRDSQMKQRQILAIQRYHSKRVAFEIGIIIGRIRARYRRMMDFYKDLHDRHAQNTMLYVPGVWWWKPYHFLLGLEIIRTLEQDIDQSVHVLELLPEEYLDSERTGNITDMNPPKLNERSGNRPEEEDENGRKFTNEEDLKRYYREKYDKDHGHDHNWTLDQYYGL